MSRLGSRNLNDMRKKFLNKLTEHEIWLQPTQQPKTHQNVIILDWDDTLLCTGYLNP